MASSPSLSLTSVQVDGYVARLGFDPRGAPADLATLRAVHVAHVQRIPFENLDISFGEGVPHDRLLAVDKIVGDEHGKRRGGWCFELNGAFALLLEALGYQVRLLGAAILDRGPSQIIDHLLLEVESPLLAPHLADVGFPPSFDLPIALNTAGPQDGGCLEFELIGSPQGTTLTRLVDGVPEALLRFKRVAHSFDDFASISTRLQTDPDEPWSTRPFATRRLTTDERGSDPSGFHRVALFHDRLRVERAGVVDEQPVSPDEWGTQSDIWFGMTPPGPWPAEH